MGQREGPGGVEEVVALRVEDGQALHHHRHLTESAEGEATAWHLETSASLTPDAAPSRGSAW